MTLGSRNIRSKTERVLVNRQEQNKEETELRVKDGLKESIRSYVLSEVKVTVVR